MMRKEAIGIGRGRFVLGGRTHARTWLVALAAYALGGCVSPDSGGPSMTSGVALVEPAPIRLELVEASSNWEPTLNEVAPWRSGEWWKVRVVEAVSGQTFEALRVVAGVEGDNYLVGMPQDGWKDPLMALHVPGFGEVTRSNFSYEIHDANFQPLAFPLTHGKDWKTAFAGRPVTASAKLLSPTVAEISYQGEFDQILATYDANAHDLVKLVVEGYASMEVVEHGYGYAGVVTVPHMSDLVFNHGVYAGVLSAGNGEGLPVEHEDVASTYDRVSFVMLVGSFLPRSLDPLARAPPQTLYEERATAPNGTQYVTRVSYSDPPGLVVRTFQHDHPGGRWEFRHVTAGPGIALTEGIAYHVYDVELPSGRVLPSKGEHAHGAVSPGGAA